MKNLLGRILSGRSLSPDVISPSYIWEGVYASFSDVPARGPGCDDDNWMSNHAASVQQLRAAYRKGSTVAPSDYGEHQMLGVLAAEVSRGRSSLRILDFGGGLGPAFVHLVNTVASLPKLDYVVIDTPKMCSVGQKLFVDDPRIQFNSDFSFQPAEVDIVYVNSSLQYIADYRGLLTRLCGLRPSRLLFVRLAAGALATFATTQTNVPGSLIPCWFLNVDEVKDLCASHGYELRFQNMTPWTYDLTNLPAECRIPGALNLIFGKSGS